MPKKPGSPADWLNRAEAIDGPLLGGAMDAHIAGTTHAKTGAALHLLCLVLIGVPARADWVMARA